LIRDERRRVRLAAAVAAAPDKVFQSGVLFAAFHTAESFVNRITSTARDPIGTPEYKVTAVRVEPICG
jgi:predicted molibdopterin-dependent oxidoreductase YjgC